MPYYYPLWYQLDTQKQYLVWVTDLESDAKDIILLDAHGCLLTFNHLPSLYEYTMANQLTITEEPLTLFDLDWIQNWTHNPLASTVDCVAMLNAWNLFSDIWQSVKHGRSHFQAIEESNLAIYNKLFYGNNLPGIVPDGAHYIPEWDKDEISRIRDVLAAGLEMLRNNSR